MIRDEFSDFMMELIEQAEKHRELNMEQWTDDATGLVYWVHKQIVCQGNATPCVFHNPSEHSMRSWPITIRETALVERLCTHGVGHPDPDSVAWFDSVGQEGYDVHGCDRCCTQ